VALASIIRISWTHQNDSLMQPEKDKQIRSRTVIEGRNRRNIAH